MDVGTNKTRKDTRAVVSLVARYRSPSTFEYVEEACCDVSLGGMFIRSKDPAAAGTLLKLECESGAGEQIRGVARVVWQRSQQNEYGPSGMGVKFVKLDPESRDVITRIVQELAEAGIEAPSMSSAPEQRGKPKISSTPAAAATAPASPAPAAPASPPPPPKAAELSATRSLSSAPPRNDVAVLHRASDRAPGTPPPPPAGSSKPPAHSGASRPAPSNALLAHAKVEPLEIEPSPSSSGSTLAPLQELGRDLPPPPEMGRDLAPLQAMVRSARVSSPPPPEERSSRAFWLVAGAVVALGAIVALFSLRAAREAEPEEHAGAAMVEVPPATAMDRAAPAPSEAQGAEVASAQVDPANEPGALPAAEQGEPAEPAQLPAAEAEQKEPAAALETATAQATTGHEGSAAPSPITPSPSSGAAQTSAPTAAPASVQTSAPGAPASAPTGAQASTPAAAQASAPAATQIGAPATQASAPAATQTGAPATQASTPAAAQVSAPAAAQVSAPAAAQANARPSEPSRTPTPTPSALPPPVVRIVPADQAPSNTQTTVQPIAAEQSAPASHPAAAPPAAASSTAESAQKEPSAAELPRVIMFTSRPTGATVTVGDQTVTTPGELNLGNMPPRIRVTAQKDGFESSTIWVNNTTEFQKVGDVMKREVHFVLPALPQPAP